MKLIIVLALVGVVLCGCQDIRALKTPNGVIIKTGECYNLEQFSYYKVGEKIEKDKIKNADVYIKEQ